MNLPYLPVKSKKAANARTVVLLSHFNLMKRSMIIQHVFLYVKTNLAHQTQVSTKY